MSNTKKVFVTALNILKEIILRYFHIALIFDTGVKYQKLVPTICQWLDKHAKDVHQDTLYPIFEMQSY